MKPLGDCAMLHIADAHVKQHIWTSCREVVGDAQLALKKAAEAAKEHSCSTLLLSGDVFDSTRPTAKDVDAVVNLCKKFSRVLYITGTHDNTDPPWVSVVPNAVHLGVTYTPSME